MRNITALILCLCCLVPSKAQAEPSSLELQVSQLTQMVKELKSTVEKQQSEIDQLRRSAKNEPAVRLEAGAVKEVAVMPRSFGKFTPEIGVVADIAFKSDSPKADEEGADRVSVREIELVLGAAVDPYSRLDALVAFTEEDTAELEEAYLTRFQLPLDLTARIGRFKPRIGKALAVHRDSLDTVDEPLVIQRYFGVEGMSKTGADVTRFVDLPSPMVHQITFGVLEGGNGEGGTAFGETKRRPTFYGRLKNYIDISDQTNLEIGLSDAVGSRNESAEFEVNVLGIDGTLIHHFNPSQNLKLQGEVFNLNRQGSFVDLEVVDDTTGDTSVFQNEIDGNVWGGYALLDLRIAPQWAAGFRYDRVEIVDRPVDSPEHADHGYTGYLTFHQSEFARWRAQFSHFDLTDGSEDNQVLIQGTFAIGDHKHKIQ